MLFTILNVHIISLISGLKALRYALSGSVFIQRVCDVIEEFGDDTDVLTMTTEVNFT